MVHGEQQSDHSTSTFENVDRPEMGRETSRPAVTTVDSTAQETKERIIERVEREMEIFRKGECSRFKASSRVANELEKWEGVSEREKGKAYNSYLAEINSFAAIQDESRSAVRGTPKPLEATLLSERRLSKKRIREEVEVLLDQVSQGEEDEEEGERRVMRKRAKEEDMPWYNVSSSPSRRSSCIETCEILLQFSEDLSGVKSLL